MTAMMIPPAVWMLLASAALMFGLVCVCIGAPGRNTLKLALTWFCASWSILEVAIAIMAHYMHVDGAVPHSISLLWSLGAQVFIIASTWFFYAAAEQKHGLHFKTHVGFAVICMCVAPFYPPMYEWESPLRLILLAVQFGYGGAGNCWVLFQAYRNSPKNSTRRRRVFIILSLLAVNSFLIFIPIQLFGEILGLFEDAMLTTGYVQLLITTTTFFGYVPIITRYNLVKVELDQVGEGLFRDIDAPVLLLNNQHQIIRANPVADETFDFQGAFERPESERPVSIVLPDSIDFASNFEVVLDTLQGVKEYECTFSDVYQMDEVLGRVLIFHDVTRERELARMKTEFTSTVSHELRTPLTSVLGFARIIERRFNKVIVPKWTSDTPKEERAISQITENLGVIISEGKRLTKLINEVLDISKMEAGKIDWNFAECQPSEFITQAIHATAGLFDGKPSVHLVQQIPDHLPQMVADRDRVVQVIINLISNAVKFTDEGAITVSVGSTERDLTMRVKDTGSGISPENQKLVFQKYKQVGDVTTDKPQGTGLGLPISREIVEQHGGRIWVESVLGEGSTFGFTIPLAPEFLPEAAVEAVGH